MPEEEVVLTQEGLQRLQEELHYLKTARRREVSERLQQALGYGDITENAEYDDAKEEQARLEGRILYLEGVLGKARPATNNGGADAVEVGCTVRVREAASGDVDEYVIVGPTESDPARLRISYQSPIGQALLGRRPGEVVDVSTPGGTFRLELLDIR